MSVDSENLTCARPFLTSKHGLPRTSRAGSYTKLQRHFDTVHDPPPPCLHATTKPTVHRGSLAESGRIVTESGERGVAQVSVLRTMRREYAWATNGPNPLILALLSVFPPESGFLCT